MNAKNTWLWLFVAAGLFAFIFSSHRLAHNIPTGLDRVLPRLQPAAVTAVQVMPRDQLPICAFRTNGGWQLSKPLVYHAQSVSIENLLAVLQQLTPATYISESEMKNRFNADEDYGFAEPGATLALNQGDYNPRLRIGAKTAPGDQLFLQVVGVEGAYVVDTSFLQFVPRSVNDWRDTTFINLKDLVFDRIAVTNGAKIFVLQSDPTNHLWRMVWPFEARAYNARIEDSLQKLESARILQFVSDDPRVDLEPLGLQPPELELSLARGTNTAALLQFGKSPINDARQVYARRLDGNAIFTVATDVLVPWQGPRNDFRDPHIVTLTNNVTTIDVRADDTFSLQRQTNGAWHVLPQNFPADPELVSNLLSCLSELRVGFAKDNVTDPGLAAYGLASPWREYALKSAVPTPAAGTASALIADLRFGTNQQDAVFGRRADERTVYAVKLADFNRLPAVSWQLRERHLWNFSENDIDRVTIRQQGKTRQIVRAEQYKWSLAPGSQGLIDDLATEETVRGLSQATASVWVARGKENRARYGFADQNLHITIELKNGESVTAEFGGASPSTFPYVATTLDGDFWVFELPPKLCRDILFYLTIPPGV